MQNLLICDNFHQYYETQIKQKLFIQFIFVCFSKNTLQFSENCLKKIKPVISL